MTIKVHQLTAPLKEVEDYLRKDIPLNGLPLYDLTLSWDSSEWFIAQRNNHLIGCLIVYTGGRGMNSFFTRGSSTAVEKLVTVLPYQSIFAIIPQEHRPIVENHYQFLSEGTFLLLNLKESRYRMPQLHETIRLFSTDLPEIDNFYSTTTAGAWNPAQLAIGPFYGIRQENTLVSICGTIGVYHANPGVAVIGNLVTLPAYQNRGYGTSVLCAVIRELFKNFQYVTLMVDSTNRGAIRIYERLGFAIHTKLQIGVCQRRKPI